MEFCADWLKDELIRAYENCSPKSEFAKSDNYFRFVSQTIDDGRTDHISELHAKFGENRQRIADVRQLVNDNRSVEKYMDNIQTDKTDYRVFSTLV